MIVEQRVSPGILTGITFDMMSANDIEKLCDVKIQDSSGVTNPKLGLPSTASQCASCGFTSVRDCDGHNGFIKLPKTIYHPYFITQVVQILNQICPGCKCIKNDLSTKDSFILETSERSINDDVKILKAFGNKNLTSTQRKLLKLYRYKLIFPTEDQLLGLRKCLKMKKKWVTTAPTSCKYCTSNLAEKYPTMKFKIFSDLSGRKGTSIVAEVNLPKKLQKKDPSEVLPDDYWKIFPNFSQNKESDLKRVNVSPSQAFSLLRGLDPEFIKNFVPRRELLFLSHVPITPNWHRVVETQYAYSDGSHFNFDERTKAYKRLAETTRKFDGFRQHHQFELLAPSFLTNKVMDCLNASKLRISSSSEPDAPLRSGITWLRKEILSKRSDNQFRMIMVGDPMIKLGEIGIPFDLSEKLLVSEHVNYYNLKKLSIICNMNMLFKEGLNARRKGQLTRIRKSDQLQFGDVIYRPLENGDLILTNRPPTVHQHSMIAFSVKILPIQSAVSINPLCCAPFLGDFDGDCLHGYVAQSLRSRVELQQLVTIDNQLLNAQDGRSLLSLTHDSLTAAHLITSAKVLLNKYEMQQLELLCSSVLPPPSILKCPNIPSPLWTGEQLFGMLLPPTMQFYTKKKNVLISGGELLSSGGTSLWLQNDAASLYSAMFRSYGRKALDYLHSAQEVLCEYLTTSGLSVSLADLYLTSDIYSRKKLINQVHCGLEEAEEACNIKQQLLKPDIEFLLNSHGDASNVMSINNNDKRRWSRRHISRSSIAAFKDVYQDVQTVVHQFTNTGNSMLAMIYAGSKGSLSKLVQQGACLGLQLFANPLSFRVPSKLSCVAWNTQKMLNSGALLDDNINMDEQNAYKVVHTSLLDGLNPLECFVHAISSRSSILSGNAEVSGTLSRKLMFLLRDLYHAYDGTVRDACGQQLVQFSRRTAKEGSVDAQEPFTLCGENILKFSSPGCQPVGSWMAWSIVEAAYGNIDHPVNSLEICPLSKLKKLLSCGKASSDAAALLFLAKRLKGWKYGFEYAALEVKNHLDRVLFSDLVSTVRVFYDCLDVEGTKFSPWITHFHLSKDKMIRKKLKIQGVLDQLGQGYNSIQEKKDLILPRVCFRDKCCSLVKQEGHDEIYCVTAVAESSEFLLKLNTIKYDVIPVVLETHIKGFCEFDKVEILYDVLPEVPNNLCLKVTMSNKCSPVKFWSTLQSACTPVMDLIDWEHSHPLSIYHFSTIYGIDAAWKYFLRSLKLTIAEMSRTVLQEHLLLVADSLFLTGEFHGISGKGTKKQGNQASCSSPFSQASFSKPESCFMNAAKQGSIDHLSGSLEAILWGKEAPVGTGGPFEIRYTEKVDIQTRKDSIYKTLSCLAAEETKSADAQTISVTWDAQSVTVDAVSDTEQSPNSLAHVKDCMTHIRSFKDMKVKKLVSPIARNGCGSSQFTLKSAFGGIDSKTDVVDMHSSLRRILNKYPIDACIADRDKMTLLNALQYHDKWEEKVGSGVLAIKVGYNPSHPSSRCFFVVRTDGTQEDFSYLKCVSGAAKRISAELGSCFKKS